MPFLFLKSASFVSKISTAFTVVKKFVDFAGRVGSIIEIYDFVADQLRDPGAVSPELKFQFDKLQSEMNQIQMKIASLANLVKDEHLKTRYATAEKVIYHCTQMFNQYLASNGSERLLNEFRNTAKDLEAEIIYLLNGMAEKDLTLSGNLIKGISNSLRVRNN